MVIAGRIWAFVVLLVLTGCVSVPTEQRFREMEDRATARLHDVASLSKRDDGGVELDAVARSALSSNLTADAAVRIALSNNRRIQAEYQRLDLAAAERLASRLLRNPEAEGSVKMSEADSSEEVVEVAAEIDVLHMLLLPKRSRMGAAQYETVEMDVARAVQRLAYKTRIAFYRLLAAEQRLTMQKTVLQAAEAGREMADRLRDAGNIKKLDQLNRTALYEQAALAVSAGELAATEAREELNVLMGLSGDEAGWETSSHLPDPAVEEFAQDTLVSAALENSVQLAVTRKRIQAAAQRLGIVRAQSVLPALHVGVEAEREPDGTWMVGPMVAVELPVFDFGQARRPAAKAALRQLQHEYAAQAIEIGSAVRTALKRATVYADRAQRYKQRLVPLGSEIMQRTQLQYNAMQLGVFQLLQAKQMELATQSAYIDELLNYWIARMELEQIQGGLMVGMSATQSASMEMPMTGGNGGH